MSHKSICHFREVRSSFTFPLFLVENPVNKQCIYDQMPHYLASDLGVHYLPMTLLRISGKDGLRFVSSDLIVSTLSCTDIVFMISQLSISKSQS